MNKLVWNIRDMGSSFIMVSGAIWLYNHGWFPEPVRMLIVGGLMYVGGFILGMVDRERHKRSQ